MKITLDNHGFSPEKAHKEDAGFDLLSPYPFIIPPGDHIMIDTGVHVEIPDGCYGAIKNRSSMFKAGIVTDGTIDSGYTGPVKIVLHNIGKDIKEIKPKDKVAQLVVCPFLDCELEVVDELKETDRGNGGFGSTGR